MLILRKRTLQSASKSDDGGYLASASDLMIGLLFVFIIMVVVLSLQIKKVIAEGNKRGDPLAALVNEIGLKAQLMGVSVQVDPKSGVIALPADTLFDVGSAVIKPRGREAIAVIKKELASKLPCYLPHRTVCEINPKAARIETIFIEGHTDSKPLNRGLYNNWHLGLDRARAVFDLLRDSQLTGYLNEKKQPIFGFSSYADERPKKIGDDAINRRVELRFVLSYQPQPSDLPLNTRK